MESTFWQPRDMVYLTMTGTRTREPAWPQERISLVGLVNLVGGSHSMKSRRRGSHMKVVADILVEACSGMAVGCVWEGLQEEGPGVQVETESWSGLGSC